MRSRVLLGLDVADEAGRAATLLTLTFGGLDHLEIARASTTRLAESLRRATRGESRWQVDLATAVEFGTATGRLHQHVAVLHPEYLSKHRWRQLADRAGFGRALSAQRVHPTAEDWLRVADYITKDAPATAAALRRGGMHRARPITFSRGWPSVPE